LGLSQRSCKGEWLERAKTLVQGQMKAMRNLERALGRPHSLMPQVFMATENTTERWVYISLVLQFIRKNITVFL